MCFFVLVSCTNVTHIGAVDEENPFRVLWSDCEVSTRQQLFEVFKIPFLLLKNLLMIFGIGSGSSDELRFKGLEEHLTFVAVQWSRGKRTLADAAVVRSLTIRGCPFHRVTQYAPAKFAHRIQEGKYHALHGSEGYSCGWGI